MAIPVEEQSVSSFPNPPALFYKRYTDENVQSGLAPQPPPPVKGSYHAFGNPFDSQDSIIRSLEEQGLQRLYPQKYDRKTELKKLNRSILICFLELLDILIENPASPDRNQKIQDISVLFINMHHLINEYRPHQAEETLRVIMERQKKQREDIIFQVQRAIEKAKHIGKDCSDTLAQMAGTIRSSELLLADELPTSLGAEVKSSKQVAKISQKSLLGQSLVSKQDEELCSVIDKLLS
eukprot:Em0020g999a